MTRTEHYETITPKAMTVRVEMRACDGCGRAIDGGAYDGDEANELIVGLNLDDCVRFYRRRDYCTVCLEPIWQAICKLIKSDPDAEGRDPEDEG